MKKLLLSLISISLVIVFVCMAKAGSEKQKIRKYSTTVQLRIKAEEDLKNSIYSYFSRELRSLGDVKIVEKNAERIISIVAVEGELITGTKTGDIAISTVITEPLTFYESFKDRIDESEYEFLKLLCENQETLINNYLFLCHKSQLQSTCQKIVVDFDIDVLEPSRKLHQRIQEVNKKSKSDTANR